MARADRLIGDESVGNRNCGCRCPRRCGSLLAHGGRKVFGIFPTDTGRFNRLKHSGGGVVHQG